MCTKNPENCVDGVVAQPLLVWVSIMVDGALTLVYENYIKQIIRYEWVGVSMFHLLQKEESDDFFG